MKTLLIIAAFFCAYKILALLSAQRKEDERKAEAESVRKGQEEIRAEQLRQREQIKASIERAKIETHERIEAEKRRIEWQKHQDAINLKMEKEQQRQAEVLEKHEDMICKMQFQLDQALPDSPMLKRQLSVLSAQMEVMQDDFDSADRAVKWDEFRIKNGGSSVVSIKEVQAHLKAREQAENKIMSQEKKIRSAEKQLAKAEFNRDMARRKIG